MKKRMLIIPVLMLPALLAGCAKEAAEPAATEPPAATLTAAPTAEPTPEPTAEPTPAGSTVSVTGETTVEGESVTVFSDSEPIFSLEEGKLTLTGCSFDQAATSCGTASDGVLFTQNSGSLIMTGCTLSSAAELTTAFACTQGNVAVTDSVLLLSGEGALLFSIEDESELKVKGSMLSLAGADETAFSLSESKLALESVTLTGPEEGECTAAQLRESSIEMTGSAVTGTVAVHTGDCALTLDGSEWTGRLETYEDVSSVTLTLRELSSMTGAIPDGSDSVTLNIDAISHLVLTEDSYIAVLSDEDTSFKNITGNGFNLYYNSELEANAALASKTYALQDGGYLIPLI